MRFRGLAVLLGALALTGFAQQARADVFIFIDKSSQTMRVEADGELLYTWPVSTGTRGWGTPNGAFPAVSMEYMHYSRAFYNAPMPRSIFFTDEGHAIHGTDAVYYLGHAASHGCVRIALKNAITLWDLVTKQGKQNTTIVVTGEIEAAKAVAVAPPPRRVTQYEERVPTRKRVHQAEAPQFFFPFFRNEY